MSEQGANPTFLFQNDKLAPGMQARPRRRVWERERVRVKWAIKKFSRRQPQVVNKPSEECRMADSTRPDPTRPTHATDRPCEFRPVMNHLLLLLKSVEINERNREAKSSATY